MVESAKFYLLDVGVANYLHPESKTVVEGTDLFGRGFEHFLLNEVRAYLSYRGLNTPLSYWRTSSGLEVDLIVGDLEVAIQFKPSREVRGPDLKGLRALLGERTVHDSLVVSREERARRTEDGIEILPWRNLCRQLWEQRFL